MLEIEKYKSGIKIKKSNRGKFTSYCGGEVTSACILRGKNSSDPAVRKRATFAANARKWKHLIGGKIIEASDNTRVVKPFNLPPIRVIRLQPQRALFSALSEDEINRRKREERLYNTLHIWNIDPTRLVTRNNVGFSFATAGIQGEPIRLGLAVAGGVTAGRQAMGIGKEIMQSFATPLGRALWGKATKDMLQFWKSSPSRMVNIGKTYIVGDEIVAPTIDKGLDMYYKSQEPSTNLQYNGIQTSPLVIEAIRNGDKGIKEIFTD